MSSEITALIQLLDDDSANVLEAVTERLEVLAPNSVPALRDAAESGNPKVRGRARELLRVLGIRGAVDELVELAARPDPDLEEMSLLLARVQDGMLDFGRVRRELDDIAAMVQARLADVERGKPRIEAFLKAIHEDAGFAGDTEDFGAYVNNFLPTVIDRRRGIPITLVLVYMLVGRRVGLRIDAIGAPFRALAYYRDDRFETFVDAYGGGQLWTHEDCLAYLKRRGGISSGRKNELLRRLTPREVMARMLRNLVDFCDRDGRATEGRHFRTLLRALVRHRDADRRY